MSILYTDNFLISFFAQRQRYTEEYWNCPLSRFFWTGTLRSRTRSEPVLYPFSFLPRQIPTHPDTVVIQ
jgi:hypothetical protein